MNPTAFSVPLWLRLAAIGAGVAILFWLPIEDTHENIANAFALLIAVLLTARVAFSNHIRRIRLLLRAPLLGIIAGASIVPLTLLLMAFKTGIHGHGAPDFTPQQIANLFQRTPYFIVGGVLIGLGSVVRLYTHAIDKKTEN